MEHAASWQALYDQNAPLFQQMLGAWALISGPIPTGKICGSSALLVRTPATVQDLHPLLFQSGGCTTKNRGHKIKTELVLAIFCHECFVVNLCRECEELIARCLSALSI